MKKCINYTLHLYHQIGMVYLYNAKIRDSFKGIIDFLEYY